MQIMVSLIKTERECSTKKENLFDRIERKGGGGRRKINNNNNNNNNNNS